MPFSVVCVVLDRRGEESVDERSLSKTRLPSNLYQVSTLNRFGWGSRRPYHDGESGATLCDNLMTELGVRKGYRLVAQTMGVI